MSKYKDIEGAVSVNGDLTPISREPINKIEGTEWQDMSLSQLHEQRGMLMTRMSVAANVCPSALPALRQGVAQIEAIINSKVTTTDTLI